MFAHAEVSWVRISAFRTNLIFFRKPNPPGQSMNIPFPPRKYLALLCAAFLPAISAMPANAQSILAWDFFGEGTNTNTTSTADVYDSQLDSTNTLTRGPGAAWSTGANSFRSQGFGNNGISTTNTDYFQFSVSATNGKLVSLNSITARFNGTTSFVTNNGNAGAANQFAYSTNGTDWTLIGSPVVVTGTNTTNWNMTATLSGIAALQNLPSSVTATFRFYASGQTTTGGWGFNSRTNGVYGLDVAGTFSGGGGLLPAITSFDPASGPAGTAVTIGGSNFTGATNVTFNGVVATFSNVTDTSISATVPASASSGPISVFTPGGTGSSTNNFLVPIPVINSFDPVSGPAGTVVTIGGSNFTGATNVAFNGVAATFSNVTDTSISATVPAGALSGPISVSTPAGLATSTNSFLVPTVSVVLPATINEGASGFGEARINVEPTNDIEVVLTSSSTNDLTVETPITFSAGTTNYTFSITAPSDSVIDANTNVTVTPAAAGYASAPGTISVVNVDAVTIPLTTFASDSYTQNFDSLGATTISNVISLTTGVQTGLGSAVSTNLNGWYAAKIAGSGGIANIVADNGSGSSGAIYNYGSTNSPANSDRSLGTLPSGSFTGAFGALVVNNTGETINSIIINLTGKFWRSSTSAQNVFTFGYGKIDNSTFSANNFLSAAGASALPGANVVGPPPVTTNGPLDGNDPANQVAISNVAIPVSLAPGESMFFRWQDFNDVGNDAGLAIDNLSLTASTNLPLPVIGSVSIDQFSLSQTGATASSSVVSDGGASLTSRGFVYALTSVSSNPVIGGSNVVVVTNDPPEVSAFTNTFTSLSADVSYSVRSFVVNGAGTNYSSAVQFSTLPVPPSFTGAYTQSFNGFTNMAALPLGWRALSTSNVNTYAGDWNATNSVSAGFYGRTNIPGVLGYLHTGSTGILSNTLTLVNNSGGALTNLFVSYVGEVNVLGTNNTRFPSWTVVVDGQTNAALAYSTASGSNEFKSAEITGLNISNGGNIVISWWSDRGTNASGSSRMIGMTGVRVATNAAGVPTIGVSGALTNFATTVGTASTSQNLSASGSDLVANILVTAPTNYQVSLDNTSFASSVTLLPTNGTVAATPVYVRIAATAPIGSPAGSVTLASSGANSQNVLVTGTVSQAGETFANWAQGAPLNSANLLLYSIGGATSPTATNGIAMSNAVTSSNLSITAIVRTNDTNLTVFGQALTDLSVGPWSTNNVTMQPGDQTGVGEGLQRQIWSTPRNSDSKKFLRLQSVLTNQ
jgi:hypothetical protein